LDGVRSSGDKPTGQQLTWRHKYIGRLADKFFVMAMVRLGLKKISATKHLDIPENELTRIFPLHLLSLINYEQQQDSRYSSYMK